MKRTVVFLLAFICSFPTFAQTANNTKQSDVCHELFSTRSISFPTDLKFIKWDTIRFNDETLAALRKATCLHLSDEENIVEDDQYACVSGIVDTEYYKQDFEVRDTLDWSIIRLNHSKVINDNVEVFVVTVSRGHSYLLTVVRDPNKPDRFEGKSIALLQFGMGNRHWGHSRDANLLSVNNIKVQGECWHETDEPGKSAGVNTTISIRKDGEIVEKQKPVIVEKQKPLKKKRKTK